MVHRKQNLHRNRRQNMPLDAERGGKVQVPLRWRQNPTAKGHLYGGSGDEQGFPLNASRRRPEELDRNEPNGKNPKAVRDFSELQKLCPDDRGRV